jgi:hypothetical protein
MPGTLQGLRANACELTTKTMDIARTGYACKNPAKPIEQISLFRVMCVCAVGEAMMKTVWNKISSMQSDVSTTELGDQKM